MAQPEATRFSFFQPNPVFLSQPTWFPGANTWISLDQCLNQAESPDFGHSYEVGSIITFFSSPLFAFSGQAREVFQFQANGLADYLFWARALISDLRLFAWYKAGPVDLGLGYRHDCKHDIESGSRLVIHDAFCLDAVLAPRELPIFRESLHPRAGLSAEAEINVTPLFQEFSAEPDRGRLSLEAELVPMSLLGDRLYAFLDARASLIYRETGGRVAVASAWNLDALGRGGLALRVGKGEVRLFYYCERLTDDWANLNPEPVTVSALGLMVLSGFP
jgi:hypothetical protein